MRGGALGIALAVGVGLGAAQLTSAGGEAAAELPGAGIVVEIHASEEPPMRAWAQAAVAEALRCYPAILAALGERRDPTHEPRRIAVVLKRIMRNPAAMADDTIYLSVDYFREHPDDVGVIVHELCHVAQRYPRHENLWLVEGIADWVRFHRLGMARVGPTVEAWRCSPRDGYGATAALLHWIEQQHAGTVHTLHRALRDRRYTESMFVELTGRDLASLWADYLRACQDAEALKP